METKTEIQRVIVYVDGFNFYYGLKRKQWKKFYWLDMVKFFESFLRPNQDLVAENIFLQDRLILTKVSDRTHFFKQIRKIPNSVSFSENI